jgi:hypothetical protein
MDARDATHIGSGGSFPYLVAVDEIRGAVICQIGATKIS